MRKMGFIILALMMGVSPALAGEKALLGALIGAGAGAAIGHSVKRGGGAGTGAAIGALGGYIIGSQMEKSEHRAQAGRTREASAQRPVRGGNVIPRGCREGQKYFDRSLTARNNDDKIFYLQQAERLCPGDARVHNDLGVAYYNRNGPHDRERARIEFKEALRINPNYTVARDNLNSL